MFNKYVHFVLLGGALSCDLDTPSDSESDMEEAANRSAEDAFVSLIESTLGPVEDDEEVIYLAVRHVGADGLTTSWVEHGVLDDQARTHVARPWIPDESGYVWADHAWTKDLNDGDTERGYAVIRRYHGETEFTDALPEPARQSASFLAHLSEAKSEGAEMLFLSLQVRDFPLWNLPLLPNATAVSGTTMEAAIAARESAIGARMELLADASQDLTDAVVANGGEVTARHWSTGTIDALVPLDAVDQIVSHADIVEIAAANRPALGTEMSARLGDQRAAERLDVDRYFMSGFQGDGENPYSANEILTMAVIEARFIRPDDGTDPVMLHDTAGHGSSRILSRWRCLETGCVEVQAYDEMCAEDDAHANRVLSAAIGDYEDSQLNSEIPCSSPAECPEPAFFSCIGGYCDASDDWELGASTVITEQQAFFLSGSWQTHNCENNAILPPTVARWREAFLTSILLDADVANFSWGDDGSTCNPESSDEYEDQIENAFDDGVFFVVSAGNLEGGEALECNVPSPADTPLAYTVTSLNNTQTACQEDYNECLVESDVGAARGGAPAQFSCGYGCGWGVGPDAVSLIDTAVPARYTHITNLTGLPTSDPNQAWGTSFAAPVVASAAMAVKHQRLSEGDFWIDLPGRMNVLMLAMTDRFRDSSLPGPGSVSNLFQATTGGDPWYGFGKTKLRLFSPSGGMGSFLEGEDTVTLTRIFTNDTIYPFGDTPLPQATRLLKCVSLRGEHMSQSHMYWDVDMEVRLYNHVNGQCQWGGSPTFLRADDDHDVKRMVAMTQADTTLQGKCVEVEYDATSLVAAKPQMTVFSYCYSSASLLDHQYAP